MTTPVLFLDDVSKHQGQTSKERAVELALNLLATLQNIRKLNKRFALNVAVPIHQYEVADGWNLQSVLGGVNYKEEWDFIRMLNDRSPFSANMEKDLLVEIESLECKTKDTQLQSTALAWASLLESATVSFDSQTDWTNPWISITTSILEDDGTLIESDDSVRNASKIEHVELHSEWLKALGQTETCSVEQLWNERTDRFPNLRFLNRVKGDLEKLQTTGSPYNRAIMALTTLNSDVAMWTSEAWPNFSIKTTPESEQRRTLCHITDDVTGRTENFEWHTRFTGSIAGRIHFRVDQATHNFVIGYIGAKLTRSIQGH